MTENKNRTYGYTEEQQTQDFCDTTKGSQFENTAYTKEYLKEYRKQLWQQVIKSIKEWCHR